MEVLELASAKDFRLEKLAGEKLYFTPDNDASRAALRRIFERLTGVAKGAKRSVEVKGRQVVIDEAAEGVAFVTFEDLCSKPLGALDYLAIAEGFHTIIMTGIPIMVRDRRAEARRHHHPVLPAAAAAGAEGRGNDGARRTGHGSRADTDRVGPVTAGRSLFAALTCAASASHSPCPRGHQATPPPSRG